MPMLFNSKFPNSFPINLKLQIFTEIHTIYRSRKIRKSQKTYMRKVFK